MTAEPASADDHPPSPALPDRRRQCSLASQNRQAGVRRNRFAAAAILSAAWAAPWLPSPAMGSLDIPLMLPVEISDIGYLNVKQSGIWVAIPDTDQSFQIGDRLSLVQKNLFYYIALDDREDMPRRLVAVRRELSDGRGSAWVTEQKDLIFGNVVESEPGMFYLRPSELMPVVADEEDHYQVLCERHESIFELRVPKALPGVGFVKHLPKSLVRQLKRREEMRRRIVLREELGRLEHPAAAVAAPETLPVFQAELSPPAWAAKAGQAPPAASVNRPAVTPPAPAPSAPAGGAAVQPPPPVPPPPASTTAAAEVEAPAPPPAGAPSNRIETASVDAAAAPGPVAVPPRVPSSPPIEPAATSQLITELARAIQQNAPQMAAAPDHQAGPPADLAEAAPPEAVSSNLLEVAEAGEEADSLAAEAAEQTASAPSPTNDAADLPLPDLALAAGRSSSPASSEPTVVSGVAGAAIKILILVVAATLVFFLALFIMAKIVNRRPRPQQVQVAPKPPAAQPAPPPATPDPTQAEPPPVGPSLPTQTEPLLQPADQGSSSSTFTGSLHGFHISELIQFLNSTKETGTLTITENDNLNQARVIFDQGEIVNAFYSEMDATVSLAEILAFDDGFFVFKRQDQVFAERVIQQSTMSLLMNMHQEIDERVLDPAAGPDPDDVFHRAEQTGHRFTEAIPPATPEPPSAPETLTIPSSPDDHDVFRRANAPAVGDSLFGPAHRDS